ncbi:MAG: hypothetical protein SGJ11_09150 [Phycisphaerae bacterium]|nr:hypothetical protein [Phycisphaerae bacterium]
MTRPSMPSFRPLITTVLAATAVITASLGGCIAVGGTSHRAPNPTVGQQLVDLKMAEERGALTADEYARLRTDVIEGNRNR